MNETGLIEVPKYFAEIFSRRLSFEEQSTERVKMAGRRVDRLIDNALAGLSDADWIILGTNYHSEIVNEPCGIESDGVMTYVFAEERGKKSPIAVFKDDHMAAKYFVWLVSKGRRKIDWELFLDMVK